MSPSDRDRLYDTEPDVDADEYAAALAEREAFAAMRRSEESEYDEATKGVDFRSFVAQNAGAARARRVGVGDSMGAVDRDPIDPEKAVAALMKPDYTYKRTGGTTPTGKAKPKKPRRGSVGRPWIDDEAPRSERVTGRITPAARLRMEAEGKSVGDVVEEWAKHRDGAA